MFFSQVIAVVVLVSAVVVQGQYKFTNCGPASDKIKLNTLLIEPHPIKAPGPVKFTLGVNVLEDITNPIQTIFDLKATAFGITLPIKCENGVGSCTYADWCTAFSAVTCPIVAGSQNMVIPMNLTATIPIGSSATVTAQINFRSATGQTGCVRMTNISVRK